MTLRYLLGLFLAGTILVSAVTVWLAVELNAALDRVANTNTLTMIAIATKANGYAVTSVAVRFLDSFSLFRTGDPMQVLYVSRAMHSSGNATFPCTTHTIL
ncbi:MAG: hypothetical protein O7G83_10260 [Proteobacteria bacterium]|nr:hypothetical protein [Pseudomonadota bacterium]